jgi:hypothetical protein
VPEESEMRRYSTLCALSPFVVFVLGEKRTFFASNECPNKENYYDGGKFDRNRLAVALAAQIVLILVIVNIYAHPQRNGRRRPSPAQRPAPSPAKSSATPAVSVAVSAPTSHESKELGSGIALDGRGKLWAVVIGISNYKNLEPKDHLQFAQRDAQEFAAFLRSPSGGGVPPERLRLLTDQEATLSAMRRAFGEALQRSVGPEDIVIIFFAGHSLVEGKKNDAIELKKYNDAIELKKDAYLLAHDSDPQDLDATALRVDEFDAIIEDRLKARKAILVTDADHAWSLDSSLRRPKNDKYVLAPDRTLINWHLEYVGGLGNRIFRVLASRKDELSYRDKRFGDGHGCFTWYLLEGLRGKADLDVDGFVRQGELSDYLSETLPKATRSLQHPYLGIGDYTQFPLSVLPTQLAKIKGDVAAPRRTVAFELRGARGFEVYIDNTF